MPRIYPTKPAPAKPALDQLDDAGRRTVIRPVLLPGIYRSARRRLLIIEEVVKNNRILSIY
jgi:hypothetical protein